MNVYETTSVDLESPDHEMNRTFACCADYVDALIEHVTTLAIRNKYSPDDEVSHDFATQLVDAKLLRPCGDRMIYILADNNDTHDYCVRRCTP